MKSRILVSLLPALCVGSAHARLMVTEIQSNQSAGAPAGANDYWELTNFSSTAISLGGYRWNDSARTTGGSAVTIPAGTMIASGESILFALCPAATFRSWWGIPSTVQVISSSNPGLGESDAVSLFDAQGAEVLYQSYASGQFTRLNGTASAGGHAGISAGGSLNWQAMVWDPASGTISPRYTFATAGNLGCFKAAGNAADIGSPGVSGAPSGGTALEVDFSGSPLNPAFGQPVTFSATAANATGAVSWQWDFGDGSTETTQGPFVTHAYAASGNFSVSVMATASNGAGSLAKTGLVTVGGFPDDTDDDGLADGLEYFFAMNPVAGGSTDGLPRLEVSPAGTVFRFTRVGNAGNLTGHFETSGDLLTWADAIPGLDHDETFTTDESGNYHFSHTLSGTGPSPAGQSVDHLVPLRSPVAGAALGGVRVVNHGMVGVGRVSGVSEDQFGETLGGSSGLEITDWQYDNAAGRFTGTLHMLPDRGAGGGNYAARVHHLAMRFTPYYGSPPVAQGQLSLIYENSHKFSYQDGTVTKFTAGINPTTNGTLFSQTVGMATAANGPGGSQQNLLSLDAEALRFMPNGFGYVSDEYGPYIARFSPNYRITGITQLPEAARPHRPAGTLNFDSNTAPVNGRRDNQGLEGIAITPDGKRLFALLQSGLVQDIGSNAQTRNNTRLFVYDIEGALADTPQLIEEYVVKLPRFDSNGNSSSINRTANQSEIVAIGPAQFLMLPQDGNGLGSGIADQEVYKAVQLVDFASATNILGMFDSEGAAVSPSGILNPAVKAAASKDILNLLDPADLEKFGINTNNASPDAYTLQEKLEGMALVPDLSTPQDDDFFLFIANDNDFQSPQLKMLGASGVLQNLGDNRSNVGNGRVTNDAVFYIYRLTIGNLSERFYRMRVEAE